MKKEEGEMSFLEHLEVFRWHLLRSVASIVIMGILAFIFKKVIFDYIILAPHDPNFWTNRVICELGDLLKTPSLCINQHPFRLVSPELGAQFSIHVTISIVAGLILAAPYVLYEFWRFVAPALYEKERKYASTAIIICSLLFFLGVIFGFYLIVPFSIDFLGTYSVSSQVENYISLMSYINTMTSILLASGVTFELPVIVYFLSKLGLITPKFLSKYRRHAYIVVLIVAAIITPPDVFSQTLVSIPLILLYEVSILISRAIYRKKEKEYAG